MNTEVVLIKRQKLNGLGYHYAAKIGSMVIDFQEKCFMTTIEAFSFNNKFKVVEEMKTLVPVNELLERIKKLKTYKYDLFTMNCEHWARFIVEGKSMSKQISEAVGLSAAIGIVVLLLRKAK